MVGIEPIPGGDRMRSSLVVQIMAITVALSSTLNAQQIPAPNFQPSVQQPVFEFGAGPMVFVDEAHNNFHTLSPTTVPHATQESQSTVPGRLGALRNLLINDGYRVEPLTELISGESLGPASIFVISNALAEENVEDWGLPNPSAFEATEVDALLEWVRNGGSLLLIADHQPWPAAAGELATELGFLFNNGYAGAGGRPSEWDTFSRANGTLLEHPITQGRSKEETISSVMTFGGQAFRPINISEVDPLIVFPPGSIMVLLEDPFAPEPRPEETITIPIDGMLQGAVRTLGAGRVAIFGEAAMFTAQVFGPDQTPMGMNHPNAIENAQFVLNVFHWLSDLLPVSSP